MPKTIKSSTRNHLFTMIEKFIDVKSDLIQKSAEKIRRLDSIISLLGSINNEVTKLKIVETVKKLKTLEENEMSTCESPYLRPRFLRTIDQKRLEGRQIIYLDYCALMVFSTKSANYHDAMNATNFMKWLEEKVITNLTKPSVLEMDNASYHVKQVNKPLTMSDSKANLRIWLQENIYSEEYYTKTELMWLVKDNNLPNLQWFTRQK